MCSCVPECVLYSLPRERVGNHSAVSHEAIQSFEKLKLKTSVTWNGVELYVTHSASRNIAYKLKTRQVQANLK